MPVHSLSEGFARITYTGITVVHHAMIPLNYSGTPAAGTEPVLSTKSGGTINGEDGIVALVTAINNMYNSDTAFGLCEFYAVDPATEERSFLYGFDIADVGTNVGENKQFSMVTMTWKTRLGNLLKMVFMESALSGNLRISPPYVGGQPHTFVDTYVRSADSIVIGRDDNYAFAPISLIIRQSDALLNHVGL